MELDINIIAREMNSVAAVDLGVILASAVIEEDLLRLMVPPELAAVVIFSADQAQLAVHSEDNHLIDIRNSVTVDIQMLVPAVIKEEDLEEDTVGATAEG
jgi:hypothetical protein